MIRAACIGGILLMSGMLLVGCAGGASPGADPAGSAVDCSASATQLGMGDAQAPEGVSVTVPEGLIDCRIVVTVDTPADWYTLMGYVDRVGSVGEAIRVNDGLKCSFYRGAPLADGTTAYEFTCGDGYDQNVVADEGTGASGETFGPWPDGVTTLDDFGFTTEGIEPLNPGESLFRISANGTSGMDPMSAVEAWAVRSIQVEAVERPGDDRIVIVGTVSGLNVRVDLQAESATDGAGDISFIPQ